jgi:hypothetical protein
VWNIASATAPTRTTVLNSPAGEEIDSIAVFPSQFGGNAVSVMTTAPAPLNNYNLTLRHWFEDLFGGYAFVAPLDGSVSESLAGSFQIAGNGDRLVFDGSNLVAYDYANPGNPRVIGRIRPEDTPWTRGSILAMRMSGGATYGAAGAEGWFTLTRPTDYAPQLESLDQGFNLCPGQSTSLTLVTFALPATTTYRWSFTGSSISNPVPLVDGPTPHGSVISGSQTATLTITNLRAEDFGNYFVEAENSCGISGFFTSINGLHSCCPADFNSDGFVNPDDLSDYITCFFLQVQFPGTCPQADFNVDGFVNPDDLSDFITVFFLGCP